jgi:hypothetical protein
MAKSSQGAHARRASTLDAAVVLEDLARRRLAPPSGARPLKLGRRRVPHEWRPFSRCRSRRCRLASGVIGGDAAGVGFMSPSPSGRHQAFLSGICPTVARERGEVPGA